MKAPYTGLTWDHPRGFNALHAAAQSSGLIEWQAQPLEGFESAPIARLCEQYDLVVLDHPHLGEALATNCLKPLDQVFSAADLARIADNSVGPSYASYHMAGHQWALPLDAATQVMVRRADLLPGSEPRTWNQVIALAEQGTRVALSLAGPHALLTFLSIAAAIDPDCEQHEVGRWLDRTVAGEAWQILATLAGHVSPATFDLNPIELLKAMARGDEIALCPLVYGYVNYAKATLAKPLTFTNAPSLGASGLPGSIVGGTGIAVSSRCRINEALRAHLLWLLNEVTQRHFIPAHAGQPSALASWKDAHLNCIWGDFYINTLNTLRYARIRPRHAGFIAFQARAAAWLREALTNGYGTERTLDVLYALFRDSHSERTAP